MKRQTSPIPATIPCHPTVISSLLMSMCPDGWRVVGSFLEIDETSLCLMLSHVSKQFTDTVWKYFVSQKTQLIFHNRHCISTAWFNKHATYIQSACFTGSSSVQGMLLPLQFISLMSNLNVVEFENMPIPFISNSQVAKLTVKYCVFSKTSFLDIPNVTSVHFVYCDFAKHLPLSSLNLPNLQKLKKLKINWGKCIILEDLFWIENLTTISMRFGFFEHTNIFENAKNLTSLNISHNGKIQSIEGLEMLPLQKLNMSYCSSLADITNICHKNSTLKDVNFSMCKYLRSIDMLYVISTLKKLNLRRTGVSRMSVKQLCSQNPLLFVEHDPLYCQ